MRLYEFAHPKDYIQRPGIAEHALSQAGRDGKADNAALDPKSKPGTKKTGRSDKES